MSILGSFYSGLSGLNTNGQSMSVISDNLANMNTIGYKKSRASFQDMMSYNVIGAASTSSIGMGASLKSIDQVMSQGSFISTGNGLDLAISGNGFFVVKGAGDDNTNYFTRDGQFHIDNSGNMVSSAGLNLQGYLANASGEIAGTLSDINLKSANSPAKATSELELSLNLNSSDTAIDTVAHPFDTTDPDSYNFTNSVTVYDSLGNATDVDVYYTKTADGAWSYNAVVKADDTTSGTQEIGASGTLAFDTDGKLATVTSTVNNNFNFAGGPTQGQTIDFNFGDPTSVANGTGLAGTTQFASSSSITYQGQDGYPTGDLQSVLVDADGIITGTFTNGQNRTMGQIAMADFTGTGLQRMGSNLWQSTTASGDALIGAANTGTRGSVHSSTLEQSNVDMTSEFVDMIVAQRAYQANSKSITTADELFQEMLRLKR